MALLLNFGSKAVGTGTMLGRTELKRSVHSILCKRSILTLSSRQLSARLSPSRGSLRLSCFNSPFLNSNSPKPYLLASLIRSPRPIHNTTHTNRQHAPQNDYQYHQHQSQDHRREGIHSTVYYTAAIIVFFVGMTYAAVPLYQLICTQTGLDGTPLTSPGHKYEPESMIPVPNARKVKIKFASSVSDSMRWSFVPVTPEILLTPGETALAFYTAHNPTEEDIVGISTYSVVPAKAAQYFNKIQCFCFEEQKLEGGEEVDMPVFFYIDPEFAYDPWMKDVKSITLHYTFFKSKNQSSSPLNQTFGRAAVASQAIPVVKKLQVASPHEANESISVKSQAVAPAPPKVDLEQVEKDRKLLEAAEEKEFKRCERWKKKLLQNSPMVRFMLENLEKAGCPFRDEHFRCTPCEITRAGGFSPDHGVILCQNNFVNKRHMEDTLTHELIHAYDQCTTNVDWGNIEHYACSAIRAANLSGDCKFTREVKRGYYSFAKHHQACVKRRAVAEVRQLPHCQSDREAEDAVRAVWDSCFNDTAPFDEIP